MLYDARRDQLIEGSSLWSPTHLQTLTHTSPHPYSRAIITESDSTQEKTFRLEMDASLKASVMAGFVEGSGSARYLYEKKSFKSQSRVTLHYKATTHLKQLGLRAEDMQELQGRIQERKAREEKEEREAREERGDRGDMIDYQMLDMATHVVTAIEYGANTFFLFDSQLLQASEVTEFTMKVRVVVHLLFWSVNFNYETSLTEEQKSIVKNLTVKFNSDFLLENVPSTVLEALEMYKQLTQLLGEKWENAVPVRVWMLPLGAVVKSEQTTRAIRSPLKDMSVGLVLEAENTLEELSDVQLRCKDSLASRAVGKFPQLQHKLLTFHKLCQHYWAELQREMAEMCPAIREGTLDESALREVFKKRDSSAFSQDKLTQWLQDKEREINVIDSILDILAPEPPQDEKVFLKSKSDYHRAKKEDSKGTVLSTQSEVDQLVLAPGDDVRVGYIFTSVQSSDPQLEEMEKNLNMLKRREQYEPQSRETGAEKQWFYRDDVFTDMRCKAKALTQTPTFAFVAAKHNDSEIGAMQVKYRNGVLFSE
uniref:Uncharacterized protein n=1 Tax=Knipowitschia caucasica TaxID=637954 RepID=A0AAV2JAG6_KNICA